jgi:fatty acid desaturase 2 (delta-6 desaturase)
MVRSERYIQLLKDITLCNEIHFKLSVVAQDDKYSALTRDFQQLHTELVEEGYFRPSYGHILYRFMELAGMLALALWIYSSLQFPGAKLLAAVILGIYGGRCGWLMHEGGHHSLTGNSRVDRFLESFVMGKPH